MKLCKDCKHFLCDETTDGYSLCRVRKKRAVDLVHGDWMTAGVVDCYAMRASGDCGEEGALWEPIKRLGLET